MSGRGASWIAVAALLGLVSVAIVLAASLPQLTLTEGTPFEGRSVVDGAGHSSAVAPSGGPRPFITFLAYAPTAIALIAAFLYAWSMRKRGTDEEGGPPVRRNRWGMIIVMLLMVPVVFVTTHRAGQSRAEAEAEQLVEQQLVVTEETDGTALPTAVAAGVGDTPAREGHAAAQLLEIALFLLALGTSTALLIAAWRLRKAAPKPPESATPALEESIDNAIRGLSQGRDAVGVVVDCYREMMGSFAATSGVDPRTLTPREFARSLAPFGLGGAALDELTALFELVRYGRRPDGDFAPRALSCMTQLRERLAEVAAAPTT